MRSIPLVLILLAGCGSTIRDVPEVAPHEVQFDGMPGLEPQAMRLEVVDERGEGARENSEKLTVSLTGLLEEVLQRGGIATAADAPFHLTVRVREQRDFASNNFDPERCVAVHGRLLSPTGASAEGEGMGCHQTKHSFGFTVGGDISESYRVALDELLRVLSLQVERLPEGSFSATAGAEQTAADEPVSPPE